MYIHDGILRRSLKNVYFLWGRGKTTIANKLREKYGFYVYSTDEAKERHWMEVNPTDQPYMCRDYEAEYGVRSFWELPKEVIGDRERHVQAEVTPILITDLIALASQHEIVICEGDLDYEAVIPCASHAVYLRNCGTSFDWFHRPDHEDLDSVISRTDMSAAEKETVIQNAYAAVASQESHLPDWVLYHKVHHIDWDDNTSVEKTLTDTAAYFGFVK